MINFFIIQLSQGQDCNQFQKIMGHIVKIWNFRGQIVAIWKT